MFWYNDEVNWLEQQKVPVKGDKPRILCYGSSSMRLWPKLDEFFPEFEVINRGFGGSTLAACSWFFKRLVPQCRPDIILFYAGDNDIGDGRHPEEVFLSFKCLMELINEYFGEIPVAFISIKPSFTREYLKDSITYTNKIIEEEIEAKHSNCTFVNIYDEMLEANQHSRALFKDDGLHMSEEGYKLWDRIIRKTFLDQFLQLKILK